MFFDERIGNCSLALSDTCFSSCSGEEGGKLPSRAPTPQPVADPSRPTVSPVQPTPPPMHRRSTTQPVAEKGRDENFIDGKDGDGSAPGKSNSGN